MSNDWNKPPAIATDLRLVHELFSAQADRSPQATAVVCGPDSLTYRALDEKSSALGNYLRTCNIGPEAVVGICWNVPSIWWSVCSAC